MDGPPPGSDPHHAPAPGEVARDLAAIEERLRSAQAELDEVTRERREAIERLGRLQADRLGDPDAAGRDGDAADEWPDRPGD